MSDEKPEGTESAVIEGAANKRVDPGFKRNITVIGLFFIGGLIILAAVAMFMRGGSKGDAAKSNIGANGTGSVASSDGNTPAMQEKLRAAQTQESDEARRRGQTYIPPDGPLTIPDRLPPPTEERPNHLQPQMYAQQTATNDPNRDRKNQERLDAAQNILRDMLVRPAPERVQVARIEKPEAQPSIASAPGSGATQPQGEEIVVDILEIFGARLTSPVDTDSSTFISAEVTTGKLAGALIVGNAKLSGEGVQMVFTGMRHAGVTYPIQAVGMDSKTASTAVEGNVDRKILARYVFPVLVAAAGGYAQSRSQVATTTTSIGGGGFPGSSDFGVARPAPTEQQAIAAGVAAGMAIANQNVNRGAQEPIRVSMPIGMSIGIMFRDAVKKSSSKNR